MTFDLLIINNVTDGNLQYHNYDAFYLFPIHRTINMRNRTISPTVLRVLYARSGNRCAFTGCHAPIFEDDNQLTGECCHIEAFSSGGPRFNSTLSDNECNCYDNLILLCSRHHKIIDGNPFEYSVEILKEMKRTHEEKFKESNLKLSCVMINQLQESMEQFWYSIDRIHLNDKSDLHREYNTKLELNELIDIFDDKLNGIEKFIEHFEFSDRCMIGVLEKLCKRLNWDFSKLEQIPYYENPFYEPNWEIHNLGRNNLMREVKMYFYALVVRVLEKIALYDPSDTVLLEKWRSKFYSFQENNYYFD